MVYVLLSGVPHIYFCDTCERGYHEMHSLVNHYSKHPSHDPMGCVIPPGEAPESEDDGTGTVEYGSHAFTQESLLFCSCL